MTCRFHNGRIEVDTPPVWEAAALLGCSIGQNFAARPVIRWWILDIASPAVVQMVRRTMGKNLAKAPLKFAPGNGVAFFEALGWKAREIRSLFRAAIRF